MKGSILGYPRFTVDIRPTLYKQFDEVHKIVFTIPCKIGTKD